MYEDHTHHPYVAKRAPSAFLIICHKYQRMSKVGWRKLCVSQEVVREMGDCPGG